MSKSFQVSRRTAIAALAAAAASISTSASAEDFELKVSHFLPPNHTFQKELARWGEELEKASGGRLKLKLYPAAQLGPPQRQFDIVRSGVADISIGLTGSTPGRYPVTEIVSEAYVAPSGGTASALTSRRMTELMPTYLASEYPGMKVLWGMVTAPLKFHTARVALRKADDFKGLRIRYAGEQFAEVISALGAAPLAVPPGETQDGLAKGIIDGATFPYEGAQSFDLGTVVKYSMEPGVSTATFIAVMNPKKFEALPKDLQDIIEKSTGPEMAARFGTALDNAEKAGREYMVAKGVEITTMPPEELNKIKGRLGALLEKRLDALEKGGKPARKFYADYIK
ncbi:TRAP transporter substrate-binding protein [Alsobacter sp. KACC 23698]|uniref:TRAP transporter substrate-binding protein n=1 Tax=Alsobacter sp. KACC 23698 TaxID=3149229 RepID=A0AAU7JLS9_9HYPH